jgi:hypothetical protein
MSEQASEPGGQNFQVVVPPEWEGGAYANFVSVWHSPYEFTLDFCATQPPQPADPSEPEGSVVIPCRVGARVKIPVTLIFDVLRALNENMTRYESSFGTIRRPGEGEKES